MNRYVSIDNLEKIAAHYSKNGMIESNKILYGLPPADVRENITAHKVIGGGEHDGATCWFECSNCHTTVDINDKYCSECGARFEP